MLFDKALTVETTNPPRVKRPLLASDVSICGHFARPDECSSCSSVGTLDGGATGERIRWPACIIPSKPDMRLNECPPGDHLNVWVQEACSPQCVAHEIAHIVKCNGHDNLRNVPKARHLPSGACAAQFRPLARALQPR